MLPVAQCYPARAIAAHNVLVILTYLDDYQCVPISGGCCRQDSGNKHGLQFAEAEVFGWVLTIFHALMNVA